MSQAETTVADEVWRLDMLRLQRRNFYRRWSWWRDLIGASCFVAIFAWAFS